MDANTSVEKTAEKLLQQQLRLHALKASDLSSSNSKLLENNQFEDLEDAVYMDFSDGLFKATSSRKRNTESPAQPNIPKKSKANPSSDAYILPPQPAPLQTFSSTDERLLDPKDFLHLISQHLPHLTKNLDENTLLSSLSPDLQYQIVHGLKLQSREASTTRVAELLRTLSEEGVDAFSKMQIDGLVRRNALTEKTFSLAKGESAVREGLGRKMAGVKGREYILKKDEIRGAGYTMTSASTISKKNFTSNAADSKLKFPNSNSIQANLKIFETGYSKKQIPHIALSNHASLEDYIPISDFSDVEDNGITVTISKKSEFEAGDENDLDDIFANIIPKIASNKSTDSVQSSSQECVIQFEVTSDIDEDEVFVDVFPPTSTSKISSIDSANKSNEIDTAVDDFPLFSDDENDFAKVQPVTRKKPPSKEENNLKKKFSHSVSFEDFVDESTSPEDIMKMFAAKSIETPSKPPKPNTNAVEESMATIFTPQPSKISASSRDLSVEEIYRLAADESSFEKEVEIINNFDSSIKKINKRLDKRKTKFTDRLDASGAKLGNDFNTSTDRMATLASAASGAVSDDMSINEIMNLFNDSKTSKDQKIEVTQGAVSDDATPDQVMKLFYDQQQQINSNDYIKVVDTNIAGHLSSKKKLLPHIVDNIPTNAVMELFEQQNADTFDESLAFTPEPEVIDLTDENNFDKIEAENATPRIADNVTADAVMELFKQQDSEMRGCPSSYVPIAIKSPSIEVNELNETTPTIESENYFPKDDPFTLFDSNTYELKPDFLERVPKTVKFHVPEWNSVFSRSLADWTTEEITNQCHAFERRKMKLPDNNIGYTKAQAIEFLIGYLSLVSAFRKRRQADETDDESNSRMNDIAREILKNKNSCSPESETAMSDHSFHSLQRRLAHLESKSQGFIDSAPEANFDDEFDEYEDAYNVEDLADIVSGQDLREKEQDDISAFLEKSRGRDQAVLRNELEANIDHLIALKRKDKREAATISSDMIRECQELLSLFGIPYITAPMEAESQCAFLASANLVDGIITDDSDVFLFGGVTVYRNMFNQNKFVECYQASKIENSLGLQRKHLIILAYLLGSDYTEGIDGVGVVTGMEILKDFCGRSNSTDGDNEDGGASEYLNGLRQFREWVISVQRGFEIDEKETETAIRKKFKTKARRLDLPVEFPDSRVFDAYFRPEVNESLDSFIWGSVDIAVRQAFPRSPTNSFGSIFLYGGQFFSHDQIKKITGVPNSSSALPSKKRSKPKKKANEFKGVKQEPKLKKSKSAQKKKAITTMVVEISSDSD
ncbi:DNA repair protein rad2 [Physocladia obscura]|uniref:DNA repair protein rad2 n=1 Tax=Physocladia obscura TaxID=109957 RepID=A0AAD5SXY7_9FUNG|nr:DNA repair protein rad2 [Physocladia obscura]